jgi:hypothetical protein
MLFMIHRQGCFVSRSVTLSAGWGLCSASDTSWGTLNLWCLIGRLTVAEDDKE